ncbi:MAG: hypothetical protein IPL39_01455 [Opitutaceae bacterium]|nr:hypothetical protein [Opitutaceae bacterium]
MITRDRARELAMAKIRATWSVPGDEPAIADADTSEEIFGWVFFYNSRRFLETGEFSCRLAGNGPVIVDTLSGEVTMLGTAGGIEAQIADYAKKKRANQTLQGTPAKAPPSSTESGGRRS